VDKSTVEGLRQLLTDYVEAQWGMSMLFFSFLFPSLTDTFLPKNGPDQCRTSRSTFFLPRFLGQTDKNLSFFFFELFKNLENPSTMNPRALFGLYESLDIVRALEEQPRILRFTVDTIKAYRGETPLQNLTFSPSLDAIHHDIYSGPDNKQPALLRPAGQCACSHSYNSNYL